MLTVDELKEEMKARLRVWAKPGVRVTDKTIHNAILSDTAPFGTNLSPKRLYKGFIRYGLLMNGHEDKEWPGNWMAMSVEALAEKLVS